MRDFLSETFETIEVAKLPVTQAYNILEGLLDSYSEYEEIDRIKLFYKSFFKISPTQFNGMVNAINLKSDLGCIPKNAADYVNAYFKRFKVEIDLRNNFKSNHKQKLLIDNEKVELTEFSLQLNEMKMFNQVANGGKQHDSVIFKKMCLFAEAHNLTYSEKIMSAAFSLVRERQQKWHMVEIFGEIQYASKFVMINDVRVHKGTIELERLMKAVVDPAHTNITHATNVMKMFMWQVKNKMQHKTVNDHIMPVFVGEQNSGKSTLIRKLCEPLNDAWNYSDFKQIVDDRNYEVFATTPIIVLDEMGYASTVDMSSLKRVLTTTHLKYRPLYTNSEKTIPMKSTFIGASNKDLSNIIYDPTGIRRFYQIVTLPVMGFDTVNDVDYQAIWQSINENEIAISIDDLKDIQKDQEILRPHDIYEDWLIHTITANHFTYKYTENYSATALFEDFTAFVDIYSVNSNVRLTVRGFGNHLSELARKPTYRNIFRKRKKRGNTGYKYYFLEDGINVYNDSVNIFKSFPTNNTFEISNILQRRVIK